jgi:hypothetical protein
MISTLAQIVWNVGLFLGLTAPLLSQPVEQTQSSLSHSQFEVRFDAGAIVSLKPTQGSSDMEYVQAGRRLGDVVIRYRQQGGQWQSANTASIASAGTFSSTGDGKEYKAAYQVQGSESMALVIETRFTVQEQAIVWNLTLQNDTDQPLEIGDLALPLPISRGGGGQRGGGRQRGGGSPVILKHSFVSGHGSFLFWMRSDSAGLYLTLVPTGDTHLEYWDTQGSAGGRGYSIYIHSAAAGEVAKERGTQWRQPHTSVTLAPKGQAGDARSYGFQFRWADDYDGVRQVLVDEGGIDVHVVPGMTVPTDLSAQFALRTRQEIRAVEAEFPDATRIEPLGTKGDYRLYQVRFARLGENRLMVRYGKDRHIFLEFFCAEPIETLIRKRAAFLARSQHRDPSKWYNGLITDWNMESQVLPSPDNYDRIRGFRIYAVTCDDPGLGKPAFLAAKNAEYPVQAEVEALDYYIKHFVWGGLQRTTEETYPYGVYGIQDWKTNRDSNDLGRNGQFHLWRVYDYPHVVLMYFSMYRVAKDHLEVKTALTAKEYLQRAYGTAQAMFTVPMEIERWSAYGTGFYNELVIVDLITELEAAGMKAEADTLRGHWERKVKAFVNEGQDLFRSEYAFDSTGFESTHALARYAMQHVDRPGETTSGITLENAKRFMETQMAANLFCRGSVEPAYYYLGSDYRGGGGNAYTLTYMSQMGGWSVLDYGLHFAANPYPYLRLGYASYLSAWALMNTGTPESNYGYWYPGKANDGGAGGGFEPAPYGQTWLGQPHHRGSWYYACEIDLGYSGALRTAATILADDPIFGRFCFGGDWRKTPEGVEVTPKDGLRRRFHAMLTGGRLHLVSDVDRFPVGQPIVVKEDLSEVRFSLESADPAEHRARLHVAGLASGAYTVGNAKGTIATLELKDGQESVVDLPMDAATQPQTFTLSRKKADPL